MFDEEDFEFMRWRIGQVLYCYANHKNQNLSRDESERLNDLYAQALILFFKQGFGIFYTIDDFICNVRNKCYVGDDGIAELFDYDGNKLGFTCCNVSSLEKAKDNGAVFVAWYNK